MQCFMWLLLFALAVFVMMSLLRWFEQTADAVDQREWEKLALLLAMPFAVWFYRSKVGAGRPAMTPRDVVDNSYDVGLCVVLDDAAGHDVYQDHPLHKEFIARNKPNWKRVQVYDFR